MAKRTRRCTAKTKAGKRCRAAPRHDTGYCNAHSPKETQESAGFGGSQEGAGRPRLPRPHELMRERIEEDLERILRPYFDAIDNAVVTSVSMGEVTVSDVKDLGARIAAAEKLLDRVYGKSRQAVEHTGEGGQPIQLDHAGDEETVKLAHELLARVRPST